MEEKYIAGFFDGEGNINKIQQRGKTFYQVRIYQGGERGLKLLKEIQEFLGYGNLYCRKFPKHPKWNEVWELTISRKAQILDFKKRIGKFCKLKKFPADEELRVFRSAE